MKHRKRILFVDDEEAVARMIKEMLERLGYEARAETDGRKAVAYCARYPARFDLVILDHLMPDLKGLEIARLLLFIRSDLPVIILTGYREMVCIEEPKETNIRAVLSKPITREELSDVLNTIL
jgi:CheY-like chemotaxis protein